MGSITLAWEGYETSALRLRRNAQPTIQELPASVFAIRSLVDRLRVHLAIELSKQLGLVVADLSGVLAEITGAEDAPRELGELLGFNGAEKPQTDLGSIRDLLQGDTGFLPESGKVQRANPGGRGWHRGAVLVRGHVVL